jgi:hypothetical protein
VASVQNNRDIIKPFLNQIAGKLSMLYQFPTLNKSLAINVAITFGRLGLVDAREVSLGYLDAIAKQWCLAIRTLKNKFEKESAFRGFILMIPHNPAPVIKYFPHICSTFVSYKEEGVSEDMFNLLKGILISFK